MISELTPIWPRPRRRFHRWLWAQISAWSGGEPVPLPPTPHPHGGPRGGRRTVPALRSHRSWAGAIERSSANQTASSECSPAILHKGTDKSLARRHLKRGRRRTRGVAGRVGDPSRTLRQGLFDGHWQRQKRRAPGLAPRESAPEKGT